MTEKNRIVLELSRNEMDLLECMTCYEDQGPPGRRYQSGEMKELRRKVLAAMEAGDEAGVTYVCESGRPWSPAETPGDDFVVSHPDAAAVLRDGEWAKMVCPHCGQVWYEHDPEGGGT